MAAIAVGTGAFGAHFLRAMLSSEQLSIWEIAVRYQMYHALALVAVGALGMQPIALRTNLTSGAFLVGTIVFSGCLYALALTGVKILGAIVPLGGGLLIVGWLLLAVAVARAR